MIPTLGTVASLTRLAAVLAACLAVAACSAGETSSASGRAPRDLVLEADSAVIPGRVPANATLASLLGPSGLHQADVTGVLAAVARVFDARKLRAGQPWRYERTNDGCVRFLEYEIDPERVLSVTARAAEPHAFDAAVVPYPIDRSIETVRASIAEDTPSLFAAMAAGGETPELPVALAGIFGGEVDFNSDLQRGDVFRVVVEKRQREGRLVAYGPIQAAELVNGGRTLHAVRYAIPGGAPSYYDRDGRSLKRFFLRSPLGFEPQVTSRFSLARLHPVLRQVRPHLGVDYRAAVGAPVVAVANGIVTAAGWRGGGGKAVSIRHASGYESSYLHLSAITVRIRARVTQGQVIGRVGATGLATGPHLDYRLSKNGRFVNPLLEHRRMPPGDPVPPEHLEGFRIVRDATLARLAAADQAVEAEGKAPG